MSADRLGELLTSSGSGPEGARQNLPCQRGGSSLLDNLPHIPPVSTSKSGQRRRGQLTYVRENHTLP